MHRNQQTSFGLIKENIELSHIHLAVSVRKNCARGKLIELKKLSHSTKLQNLNSGLSCHSVLVGHK